MAFFDTYRGRRVLVTGDTGFKGAWLCEWLLALGAELGGCSLSAEPGCLFEAAGLRSRMLHRDIDVRDLSALVSFVDEFRPDFVLHLAAQALVRPSYRDPVGTFATNVMGVSHVLEAVRLSGRPCSVVIVTSDKCYANREWLHGYREDDPLGGHDPYSASKGAAEIVTASYRDSFFPSGRPVAIASARAGNVIGGGDWSQDRIVPDCIRALQSGRAIQVRNPASTRPWQHVLEPLSGYLLLGACLDRELRAPGGADKRFASAFNFGPGLQSNRSVESLVTEILRHWPGTWEQPAQSGEPHEAGLLSLSIDKANRVLGWSPVWNFETSVALCVGWYREVCGLRCDAAHATRMQINEYMAAATAQGLSWTK
jgi:CDP-glucose 4,6-dehydratase